jgi:hypothetical protein
MQQRRLLRFCRNHVEALRFENPAPKERPSNVSFFLGHKGLLGSMALKSSVIGSLIETSKATGPAGTEIAVFPIVSARGHVACAGRGEFVLTSTVNAVSGEDTVT